MQFKEVLLRKGGKIYERHEEPCSFKNMSKKYNSVSQKKTTLDCDFIVLSILGLNNQTLIFSS